MKKLTKQDGKSLDIVNENLVALKAIFPEAFTEDLSASGDGQAGGVDFEMLRQLLGDAVDEGEEKYGLTWHGKKKARQIALMPSLGTLRPCPEESVGWDTTQNLFIEGDNLEVLKLLQKSYANKVKMIYIDPPYNTGKEFIYPDKFQDNLDTYLRYTGQKDDEGFKISSNTESSGRYHTNWLNMMYPRLKLARNLLREDGVIFISIDDNEVSNLRKLCDEIWGEENFITQIVWQKRTAPDMRTTFSEAHEYILLYGKSNDSALSFNKLELTEDQKNRYKNPDNDPKGPWVSSDFTARGVRPNQLYGITTPSGKVYYPPEGKCWQNVEEGFLLQLKEGRFYFGANGDSVPRRKNYLNETDGRIPWSWWSNKEVGHSQEGKFEVNKIFSKSEVFSTPKPVRLIKRMIQIATADDSIVLDFFAGSATTAHATIQYSLEKNTNTRFIAVQLPEILNSENKEQKAGYDFCIENTLSPNVADIGKERIRRVIKNLKLQIDDLGLKEAKKQPSLLKGDNNQQSKIKNFKSLDLGFKVFKLDSSNIRAWNPDRNDLEQTLLDHMEHLVEGRSEEDVLYELLLKRGVDLTVPMAEKTITGKTVYSIGYGALFACLDTAISREEVEDLAMGIIGWHKELEPASDTQVVFRDSAFANDIAKTNMTAILEQNGIKHVRSL